MARKPRTQRDRQQHAAGERARYASLKRGLLRAIALASGLGETPRCMMLRPRFDGRSIQSRQCGRVTDRLEVEHVHFTRFRQRKMNSVQRLERFAAELVRWMGGDESRALAIACRSCNAAKQPPRKR